MNKVIKSARGEVVDMEALVAKNPNTVAVTGGGISMNARGDFIGSGGKVIKTREEFEVAYNESNPNATEPARHVSIKKSSLAPDFKEDKSSVTDSLVDENNVDISNSTNSKQENDSTQSKSSTEEKEEESSSQSKKRRVTIDKD